jgi:RNA polymerase sigma-70 factor (ECF subfamily)
MSGPASGAGGADLRDDRELLAAHVAGDAEAFGTLFARHRDRLWAVALRTTSDPEDAADALQDAMVAAFRRADSFRGEAAVTTWLHRIVVNACLDRLRRRKVRLADPLPEDLEQQPAPDLAVAAAAGVLDPADLAVDDERRRAVLAALDSLPPDQRAALVLVDMEGYSVEETARILDCAPGTVKSRCSRGRARLLPLLVDHRPQVRTPAPPGNQRDRPRVAPPGTSAPGELSDAPPAERPGVVPSAGGEDR